MAVNTQFSIAVHIMAGLGCRAGECATSAQLAESVNTSPSFVRRVLAKLSKAHLIETATGKAGSCWLAKNPKDLSLLQIYRAVDAPKVFAIHKYAAQKPCPVSCNIKSCLETVLTESQKAMEARLAKISLADLIAGVQRK
jgi:Rrf2 family protein